MDTIDARGEAMLALKKNGIQIISNYPSKRVYGYIYITVDITMTKTKQDHHLFYVGRHILPKNRTIEEELYTYNGSGVLLSRAKRKGHTLCTFVLEYVYDKGELRESEDRWLRRLDCGNNRLYKNIAVGAYGSESFGLETRTKISEANRKNWADPEYKRKQINGMYSKVSTQEARKAQSERSKLAAARPGAKDIRSEAARLSAAIPENKARHREAMRKANYTPEKIEMRTIKAKMIEAYKRMEAARVELEKATYQYNEYSRMYSKSVESIAIARNAAAAAKEDLFSHKLEEAKAYNGDVAAIIYDRSDEFKDRVFRPKNNIEKRRVNRNSTLGKVMAKLEGGEFIPIEILIDIVASNSKGHYANVFALLNSWIAQEKGYTTEMKDRKVRLIGSVNWV